jgi:zinc/manganese transport system substrate-binding protein
MGASHTTLRLDIPRRWHVRTAVLVALVLSLAVPLRSVTQSAPTTERPDILVTTGVLGAVVRDLVGDAATVSVLMGDGVDPHEWSPSAQDIETLHHADLVIANGAHLEAAIDEVLDEVAASGVTVFRAMDHVAVRGTDDGLEGAEDPTASHDREDGPVDPHFWTDPLSMRDVVSALVPVLTGLGVDTAQQGRDLMGRLTDLDAEVRAILAVVPAERRKLVTGHESMGYFAARYGFQLVGAIIPGLSSQGEVSASQLAAIAALIREQAVPAIFTEVGTSQAVVDAIAGETGVQVVPLPSHALPADGSYLTFIRDIATAIAGALA